MLILYGVPLSTFTRKVRLALAEKRLDCRLEVAAMGSPKVRMLHPLGKIPVLKDEGTVIPDSSVIIAYLERAYPEFPLYPENAREMAQALWLEEYADTRLRETTVPYFAENVVKPLFQGKPADADVLSRAGPARDECFAYLEKELSGGGFAVAGRLSVADIAIGSQLVTYRQGGGDLSAERWPGLSAYAQSLARRSAWVKILAEEESALEAARARRR